MSARRSWTYSGRKRLFVVVMLVLLASPGGLTAQTFGSCGFGVRAGVAVPDEISQLRTEDSQFGELNTGWTFGVEGVCPLGGPWSVAVDIEHGFHETRELDTPAYQWRFTGGIGAGARLGQDTRVSLRVRGGWQISESDFVVVTPDASRERTNSFVERVFLDDDGPVVGSDVRLAHRIFGSLSLFADAGWRMSWFDTSVVESGTQRRGTETVHVFPLTGGVTVRF